MFKVRTSPVEVGTKPYVWNIESVYQCTWYGYYRALEVGFSAPTWWDRPTKTGSYPNAKDWLENYRDPWQVKDKNWKPVAGDILVYDGEYGHIIFCESDSMTSEYRSGDPNSFRNAKIGDYKGELLGILHYPYESVLPVERNENVNQIETTDESLRIRTEPSLEGEVVGHVQLGYYNVLNIKEASEEDKNKEPELKCWYEISKDRWIANITTIYHEASGEDVLKELEKYFNALKRSIDTLSNENANLKADMKKVNEITRRWV